MLPLLAITLLSPQGVEFARDVQPILVENCFACHGPDAKTRKGDLRLDTKEGALDASREDGAVIVPRDVQASLLFQKIVAHDPADRMPPPKSGKALDAKQVETIRAWIEQGASWGRHWSFVPPVRPPASSTVPAGRSAIDHFVRSRLRREGLSPSPPADRRTLVRRLSLDLTGLPPSRAMIDGFSKDTSAGAYERLVDRLLASPHYGERMAMVWLDAARYADTDGFQADATRTNWPWRDWVVDAYNANKPFDEFTIEQFAGDLLPERTPEQILATCFHRNHMTNGEGGRDPEESRVDYVIDRVNTLGTVWLGLTLGCSQCHDHKYDPVSQAEYYGLNAFFNSIDEDGRAGGQARPHLAYESPHTAAGVAASERWLVEKQQELRRVEAEANQGFPAWLADRLAEASPDRDSWHTLRPRSMRSTHGSKLSRLEDGSLRATGANPRHEDYIVSGRPDLPRLTGMRLTVLPDAEDGGRLSLAEDGHIILTNLKISVRTGGSHQVREVEVRSAVADFQKKKKGDKAYGPVRDVLDDDPRTGWSTLGSDPTQRRTALFAFASHVRLGTRDVLAIELRHRSLQGSANMRRFRIELTSEAGPAVEKIGPTPRERLRLFRQVHENASIDDLSPADRKALRAEFLADIASVQAAREIRDRARRRRDGYRKASRPIEVMVLARRKKPRRTHILERGVWNKRGAAVTESTPRAFREWPKGVPKNRLGLARYLVDGANPLTARVAVNRYWQMYFGAGLVKTPEDFGRQGARPSHPELLDWLACEFVSSGWNIKHIQKLIVMSATYRQTSDVTPELRERDPENRLLARASRFRLPSWIIRDAALHASGLLQPRLGGPPVFPYQPAGVWADSSMGRFHYERSVGDDLYRRSIYGFWRRLVTPTGMFDAPKRRTCQVRVVRTNTPLQALALMNDLTYVEAARVLAEHVLQARELDGDRVAYLVERVLSRPPDDREAGLLKRYLADAKRFYVAHESDAMTLASQGDAKTREGLDTVDVAVWTLIASTVLNLDEAVTRQMP